MNVMEWLENALETEKKNRLAFGPIWEGMKPYERMALISLLDELQTEAYLAGFRDSRDGKVVGF